MSPTPNRSNSNGRTISSQTASVPSTEQNLTIDRALIKTIDGLKEGFRFYPIRDLVQDTEKFGTYLKTEELKTNQIRKFLDAINRLKFQLSQSQNDFNAIKDDLIFLKPKLAYAAAKAKVRDKNPVEPFSKVITTAIGKVDNSDDFNRLVQFVESIIAYHKAAGGE